MRKSLWVMLCLVFSIFSLMTASGVYAIWRFSEESAATAKADVDVFLSEFEYAPEELLPGGDIQATLGENHLALITKIVEDLKYGLNSDSKTVIHDTLKNPGDVIYCDQKVTGGNLKHVMLDGLPAAERLYFVITKISNTEYHTFTMKYADMLATPAGSPVKAYKTVMVKDGAGVWKATLSYVGEANVNAPGIVVKGIDPTSFKSK